MGLSYELKGDAYDRLSKIIAACDNSKPAFDAIGNTLTNRIRMGFRLSRSPWGDSWKPITYRQGKPLRDTGRLLASITHNAINGSVSIGTDGDIPYAKIHQFSGVITPRTAKTLRFFIGNRIIFTDRVVIPARPYLPIRNGVIDLPQSWSDDVADNLAKHIENKL